MIFDVIWFYWFCCGCYLYLFISMLWAPFVEVDQVLHGGLDCLSFFRHVKLNEIYINLFVKQKQQFLIWTSIWLNLTDMFEMKCLDMSWSILILCHKMPQVYILCHLISIDLRHQCSWMFMAVLLLLRFFLWALSYPKNIKKHWRVLCFICATV